MNKEDLFDHLEKNSQVLLNPGVKGAFAAIDRADFVGEDYKIEAYEDYAVPAGHGQNVSKPTIAAFMLEVLDALPGQNILEIGSGSGYVTALIAEIVGPRGKITGVEALPELVEQGRKNIGSYAYNHVSIEQAGEGLGKPESGPYDRILCMCDAEEPPQALIDQLREGGILVLPVRGSIVRIEKLANGKLNEKKLPGTFEFSPLRMNSNA